MSTLNIGDKHIIEAMETYNNVYENATMKFTVTFKKKLNIIYCILTWTAKVAMSSGSTTTISSAIPAEYRPVGGYAYGINYISSSVYRLSIDTAGTISFWLISGNIGAAYGSNVTFAYMITDN